MLQQVRIAVRSLLRRPVFTTTVVLTLALGLGASASVFNIVDAVLLRSLPYQDPDRLVALWETVTRESVERRSFAYPDFEDLKEQSRSFDQLAAYDATFFTARGDSRAERVAGAVVSKGYLELLDATPMLGVSFESLAELTGGEDGAIDPKVVLSHRFWQRRFGGEPSAVGRTLELDGDTYSVIGVLRQDFVPLVDGAELWTSIEELPQRFLKRRGARWHSVVGRLSPDVTVAQARDELAVVFSRLEEQYPDTNLRYGAELGSLSDELFGDLRAPLLTLLGAVGLVLLVSCANVAGLLLVHAARRAPETALRRALGASSFRLLRSRSLETTLLGLAGGVLGIGLAVLVTRVLLWLSPIELPSFVQLDLGPRLVAFALLLSFSVSLLLALGSLLLRRAGDETASTLRSGTGRSTVRQPALTGLLVAEVALATVLAVGAGLLLTSFNRLLQVEPGFETERLVFARVGLPPESEEDPGQRASFRAQLLETARAQPSVRAVALATDSPLDDGYSATVLGQEGGERQPDQPYEGGVRAYRHLVSPGYFEAVSVPLLRGRGFETSDRGDSQRVAVVSQRLADRMWPGQEALSQRFKFGPPLEPGADSSEVEWVTVVGVVAEHRFRSLIPDSDGPPEDPDVFFSIEQFNPGNVVVVAATEGEPTPVLAPLRAGIEGVSPALALFSVETVGERLFRETARPRFASSLMAAFSAMTLFLAALGIWGMVAYQVAARVRDIGIRLALGAGRADVVRQLVLGAGRWVVLGVFMGLVASFSVSRFLSSQLFEVAFLEPGVYLSAALLLLIIGLAAATLPALRAGRVDPAVVLRSEG